jgi:hypothetical protein
VSMPDSPDFGNDLHQHPDLLLVPQLQNLFDRFFTHYKTSAFRNYRIFSQCTIQPDNAVKSSKFA